MTLTGSPMPPAKQAEALIAIRQGFEEAGREMGFKIEVKVVPMPDNYDLTDLRDYLIASA